MIPSVCSPLMVRWIKHRRPFFLWGPPGVGKSDLVYQAASALDYPVIDLRASLLNPVDLRGIPVISTAKGWDGAQVKVCEWAPPIFLPRTGHGLIFCDELPNAPTSVQTALLQLILDRRLGEYVLPEGWSIAAAGNRVEDKAGANRTISSVNSRFTCHVELEVSATDWLQWALGAGIRAEVRSFVKWQPSRLTDFDPRLNQKAYACPRTWSFVSDHLRDLDGLPEGAILGALSGCVGEGVAAEFWAHVQMSAELPDPDELLAKPTGCELPDPDEPGIWCATVTGLIDRLRVVGEDTTMLHNFGKLVMRFPAEYQAQSIIDGFNVARNLDQVPEIDEWMMRPENVERIVPGLGV